MSRASQLAKNTLIVAVGKICTQFATFLMLPLYTSFLSTEEFGSVDLLNTYTSLLIPIIYFQMEQAIFRFLIDVRKERNAKEKLIASSFYIILLQSLAFILIYLVVNYLFDSPYKHFLAANVVCMAITNLLLQICRGLGDNLVFSLGSLISGLLTIVFNIIFIVGFHWGAVGMLTATIIANIIASLFLLINKKLYRYLHIHSFDKKTVKKLWTYSIPLIPNQLSWWIINASDRTVIKLILGVAFNGIYSVANKFSSILTTVFNIFNMTWAESASMHIKDKDSSAFFTSIVDKALRLFIMLCLDIIVIMPFIFKAMIPNESYSDAYMQIPILLISTIFNIFVSLMGSIYVALKKTKEIAKTSIYAAVINIVVNLLLIKFIGLFAASISTLVAFFAMSIYRYVDIQKYITLKIEPKLTIIFALLIIEAICCYYINTLWLNIVSLTIIAVASFILNYGFLVSVWDTIHAKLTQK